MEQTEKQYILTTEVALSADSIEKAQEIAERIISAIPDAAEGEGNAFLIEGTVGRARADKPVELFHFGSDKPYANLLATQEESVETPTSA